MYQMKILNYEEKGYASLQMLECSNIMHEIASQMPYGRRRDALMEKAYRLWMDAEDLAHEYIDACNEIRGRAKIFAR